MHRARGAVSLPNKMIVLDSMSVSAWEKRMNMVLWKGQVVRLQEPFVLSKGAGCWE